MSEFHLDKIGNFVAIGIPTAVLRVFVAKHNRSWDILVANIVSAAVIGPLVGMVVSDVLDNPLTSRVEGRSWAFAAAAAASLIGIDILRGLIFLGEQFAKDPAGTVKSAFGILGKKNG